MSMTGASKESSTAKLSAYAPALRRYFSKRIPLADVDDLVQEVFVNMLNRRCVETIDNLGGYLFAVAANVLIQYGRKNQPMRPFEDNDYAPNLLSPDRYLQSKEDLTAVVAALRALPNRTRQVFVLHRFEELTYGAIARRLNISVSAVEKHIMAALRALLQAKRA